MLEITKVKRSSEAWNAGLREGDILVNFDGLKLEDDLDLFFRISDQKPHNFTIKRNNKVLIKRVFAENELGLKFAPFRIKKCKNKCLFCFIDQLPEGLRKELYIKDEDFRLSFLYGNFITLRGIDNKSIKRIVEQRFSPLYVSVHSTNPNVRAKLLGLKNNAPILPILRHLTGSGIKIHAQIVIIPGMNDGDELLRTIMELENLFPSIITIGIVPVGLTKYRKDLPFIRSVTPSEAFKIIMTIKQIQILFKKKYGNPYLFLADEFYLLSGMPIPRIRHYGEFHQIENGIGIYRKWELKFKKIVKKLPDKLINYKRWMIVTGRLAENFLIDQCEKMRKKTKGLFINVISVDNNFFGEQVSVAGLLCGGDIIKKIKTEKKSEGWDGLLLPPDILNIFGKTLDGYSIDDISKETGMKAYVAPYESYRLFSLISGLKDK